MNKQVLAKEIAIYERRLEANRKAREDCEKYEELCKKKEEEYFIKEKYINDMYDTISQQEQEIEAMKDMFKD